MPWTVAHQAPPSIGFARQEYWSGLPLPPPGKSILNIHWKDWCWSSNTLATWCKELTYRKRHWYWEHWRKEEKRTTEGESLDSITDSMDISLSKLCEVVKDREAWNAAVHRVTKSRTWLHNWTTTTTKVDKSKFILALMKADSTSQQKLNISPRKCWQVSLLQQAHTAEVKIVTMNNTKHSAIYAARLWDYSMCPPKVCLAWKIT